MGNLSFSIPLYDPWPMGNKFSMTHGPYIIVRCRIPHGSWENYNFLKWHITHFQWGKIFPWPMDCMAVYDAISPRGRGVLSHRMAHGSWEKSRWMGSYSGRTIQGSKRQYCLYNWVICQRTGLQNVQTSWVLHWCKVGVTPSAVG